MLAACTNKRNRAEAAVSRGESFWRYHISFASAERARNEYVGLFPSGEAIRLFLTMRQSREYKACSQA